MTSQAEKLAGLMDYHAAKEIKPAASSFGQAAAELRLLAAEVEAQRKWINEAIQPLGLYQAYGWSDRMGVIARGRKLLENHHG